MNVDMNDQISFERESWSFKEIKQESAGNIIGRQLMLDLSPLALVYKMTTISSDLISIFAAFG